MSIDEAEGLRSETPQTRRLLGDFSGGSRDDVGRFLEEFRPYLLTIATDEFPDAIHGKLGVSDIVQETILKGLEKFDQFQGTTREEFAQWLKTILCHQMANVHKAYRSLKRDVALEVSVDNQLVRPNQPTPSDEALTRERKRLVEEAMSRLADEDRETILLRHRENLTFAQIALRMQKSEDAARNTWIRAITQLKQELRRDDSKNL